MKHYEEPSMNVTFLVEDVILASGNQTTVYGDDNCLDDPYGGLTL